MNSLRTRLLVWLVIPMVFLCGALVYSTYVDTKETSKEIFDRLLVSMALSISQHALATEGDLLTDDLLEMIRVVTKDNLFYKVRGPDDAFLIGYSDLPEPQGGINVLDQQVLFYDASFQDQSVRIVAVSTLVNGPTLQGWMTTFLAQTLNDRDQFISSKLSEDIGRLLLLILILSILCFVSVTIGLKPLTNLQKSVDKRNPHDLSPLKLSSAPIEIKPVVYSLNDLLSRLSSHITLTKKFVENAAHQLRTPVSSLIPQTDLALRGAATERERNSISKIRKSATKLGRLTNQLLSLTYADSISLADTKFATLSLEKLAQEQVTNFSSNPNNLEIVCQLTPVNIHGSELLVKEIIDNLIDNAIKYNFSPSKPIVINTNRKDNWALLRVSNSAKIEDVTKLDDLFNRFVRLDENQVGSGLGLAIVKELVEIHSGKTDIKYNEQDQRFIVECYFPVEN